MWDFIDDNYTYYNNAINEAFVRLGLAYADYLQAGGTPLFDVIGEVHGRRRRRGGKPRPWQSLHDNLLGNLEFGAIRPTATAAPTRARRRGLRDAR